MGGTELAAGGAEDGHDAGWRRGAGMVVTLELSHADVGLHIGYGFRDASRNLDRLGFECTNNGHFV